MKNLGGSLKKIDLKQFFIKHGEKIGIGIVAILLVWCLMSTEWAQYPRSPKELADKAKAADLAINQSVWPKEHQDEVPVIDFVVQAEEMLEPMNIEPYVYNIPMSEPLEKPIQLVTSPKWLAPDQVIADDGAVLVQLMPEQDFSLLEEQFATTDTNEPTGDVGFADKRRDDILKSQRGGGGGRGFQRGSDDDDDRDRRRERRRRPSRRRRGDDDDDDGRGRFGVPGTLGGYGSGVSDQPLLRARGERYAAVRAIFDLRQQIFNVGKALRYPIPARARDDVVIQDFRIQRQRAVAGPNPWRDENWEELDIDHVKDVLAEVAGFDVPVMDPRVTNPVITMPLAQRVTGYWTRHATHPALEQFKLSNEEREQVEKFSALVREEFDKLKEEEENKGPGGFGGLQYDLNELRNKVWEEKAEEIKAKAKNTMPEGVNDRVKQIFGLQPKPQDSMLKQRNRRGRTRQGLGGGNSDDDDDDGGRFSGRGMRSRIRGQAIAMRGSGVGGRGRGGGRTPDYEYDEESMRGIDAAVGRLLLFRYFDFTVESGEAYRYRIKFIFRNPAAVNKLKRDEVDDEAVIEGATRESEWSEPSNVVVIPADTQSFVTKIIDDQEPGRNGAQFEVFQWHRDLGTVIHDEVMRCSFGEFLGGSQMTEVLNPAKPSFKNEMADFTSDIVLVDAIPEAVMDLADHPDLQEALQGVKGVQKEGETDIGVPAEVVVVRSDGRTVRLDSLSHERHRRDLKKKLDRIHGQYQDLKREGETASAREKLLQRGLLVEDGRGGRGTSLRKRQRGRRGGGGGRGGR